MTDIVRLRSTGWSEVDDPVLDDLDKANYDPAAVRAGVPRRSEGNPFDLELMKPQALAVARLYALAGTPMAALIEASPDSNVPVLMAHGMTPFYRPGLTPTGVWGMGYRATIEGDVCSTIALFPDTRRFEIGHLSESLQVGLRAGGEMGLLRSGALTSSVPLAVGLPAVELKATTNQEFGIAIDCKFSLLEVQAGPVGAGGARWNLYRQREAIDERQSLFHTILVPRHLKKLTVNVECWVRRSGRFFGLVGARHWEYPVQTYQVSLPDLESLAS